MASISVSFKRCAVAVFFVFVACCVSCYKNTDPDKPNGAEQPDYQQAVDVYPSDKDNNVLLDNNKTAYKIEPSVKEASVVKNKEHTYQGNLTIPNYISYNGERYAVTIIEAHAFYRCSDLLSITLPETLQSIKIQAFSGCSSLTSITIPDNVKTIEAWAFEYCNALESVNFGPSAKLTTLGDKCFASCGSLYSISIPSSVSSIGNSMFTYCTSLNNVTINGKFTAISDDMFSYCEKLQKVIFENSIEIIGKTAFYQCHNLLSITLPETLQSIKIQAFSGCSSLRSVECKPTTPPLLGQYVFDNTPSSLKIYVPTQSVSDYKNAENWTEYQSQIVGKVF